MSPCTEVRSRTCSGLVLGSTERHTTRLLPRKSVTVVNRFVLAPVANRRFSHGFHGSRSPPKPTGGFGVRESLFACPALGLKPKQAEKRNRPSKPKLVIPSPGKRILITRSWRLAFLVCRDKRGHDLSTLLPTCNILSSNFDPSKLSSLLPVLCGKTKEDLRMPLKSH